VFKVFSLSRADYDAVLLDLDGVVTETAKIHAKCWKRLFDEYLGDNSFDIERDYLMYVDGRPRYEGVKSFLESREIFLSYGTPEDSPDTETVCGLGNKKNQLFHEYLKNHEVEAYPDAIVFLRALKLAKFKTAVVSSSKNCEQVVRAAKLEDRFDTRVDGKDSECMGLHGKPDPDIFLEAASRLNVQPHRSVVVEDAIAGVEAGKRGKFGFVIGMNRHDTSQILLEHGAHIVINSFNQIEVKS